MSSITELPEVGDVILYKLRPIDLPTDYDRQWKGKVIKAYPETYRTLPSVDVELLEEGFEGEIELVMLFQIVAVVRLNG